MKSKPHILLFALLILVLFSSCSLHQNALPSNSEIADLEEYLIDFSKKMEGHRLMQGTLPPNLDATEFLRNFSTNRYRNWVGNKLISQSFSSLFEIRQYTIAVLSLIVFSSGLNIIFAMLHNGIE